MSAADIPFTLKPFAATPAVRRLAGSIARSGEGLQLRYQLDADPAGLRLPAPCPPAVRDGLWRHTCCELFVARADGGGYLEFNFSPAGEWAIYAFSGYREQAPLPLDPAALDPGIALTRSAGGLQLSARARLDRLWPALAGAPLRIALSAVIEEADGSLSYWALNHPGAQPDFHHPDAFVLQL